MSPTDPMTPSTAEAGIPDELIAEARALRRKFWSATGPHEEVAFLAAALMAERERAAGIARKYADSFEKALPHYGAADKDTGRGRQEGHISAGREIALAILSPKEPK